MCSTEAVILVKKKSYKLTLYFPLFYTSCVSGFCYSAICWTHVKLQLRQHPTEIQCGLTCCRLLVLLVLDRAGGRVAGWASVLWGAALLGLASGRGRRLGVLGVRVQGGAGVGVLLRHRPWRHWRGGGEGG